VIVSERTTARLGATTRFGDIREFAEIGSTNRYLLEVARSGGLEGAVAIADFQREGRGRQGRSWQAPAGTALLASILLRPRGLGKERPFLVTAALGLAAADACQAVAGVLPAIKWPNDLVVDDRKLAGILAQAEGDAVVAGIGLNVSWAPDGAVSLASLAPSPVDRGELLAAVLASLDWWCDRWDAVARAYRSRCATVGRRVRVELAARTVIGVATSIDERGWLRVAVEGGEEVVEVSAADVIHLRSQ